MPPRHRRHTRTPGTAPLNPQDIARAATMKRYRETRDITQTELASILGVSQASIAAYEAAKTRIPDDVYKHLADTAAEDLAHREAQENGEARVEEAVGAGSFPLPPMPDGDMPPEVMQALKDAGDAMRGAKTPEEAASKLAGITAEVGAKARASMPREKQAAARDVQLAYGMLARILGRFDPILSELVDQQSGELAVSVVEAAEVSPFFERIVRMMRIGPVSTCIALHVLLLAQYDERRRAVRAEQKRIAELSAPKIAAQPEPAHVIEGIDPTLVRGGSAFEAAASAA